MAHTIEPAASGRAKCRGCGEKIEKGELRFGERLPNPFADEGDMTLWFHLMCGAYKRPEALLEILGEHPEVEDAAKLEEAAKEGLEHRRLPRVDGAERASTGRATCRSCREMIEKDTWRIRLVFYEDGRFAPSGFIHTRCAAEYLGTSDVIARAERFSGALADEDRAALHASLQSA